MFNKINKYCPLATLPIFLLAFVSVGLHIAVKISTDFADRMNSGIAASVRRALSDISGIVPFSVFEGIVILLPAVIIVFLITVFKLYKKDLSKLIRVDIILLSIISLLYSLYVFTLLPGYNTPQLNEKLGFEQTEYDEYELFDTCIWLSENINGLCEKIPYKYQSSSVMPYARDELTEKINKAYDTVSKKYDFLKTFNSKVKPIIFSEAMTYTHISGLYGFVTGEANINMNFPDYTIPFTVAHEMAHQRGFSREDEANFIAFLVCSESDDPYIAYSGYLSVYEYVISAANKANEQMCSAALRKLSEKAVYEMRAYNDFFEKYRENKAAEISSAVNDGYLKSQGQSEGEQSYGLVTDLTVYYYLYNIK